ncbi:mucin-2-like isoform X2 [Tigriopus californicus]|uniref:mucin-2-like isoform X2 n=1 Tax=Tigriopus californicus TaxID=6832 RepID=UPI0027DA2C9E|nr:mucin-2-like isoform X2 [Tigriopus californicus]
MRFSKCFRTKKNSKNKNTLTDCVWDFFACRKSAPSSSLRQAECCDLRFDNCCQYIMDPEAYMDSLPQPSNDPVYPGPPPRPPTPEPETTTTTEKPYIYADTMIGCIWQFNGCIASQVREGQPENICYQRFDECKMLMMGIPLSTTTPSTAYPTTTPSTTRAPYPTTTTSTTTTAYYPTTTTTPPPVAYPRNVNADPQIVRILQRQPVAVHPFQPQFVFRHQPRAGHKYQLYNGFQPGVIRTH